MTDINHKTHIHVYLEISTYALNMYDTSLHENCVALAVRIHDVVTLVLFPIISKKPVSSLLS